MEAGCVDAVFKTTKLAWLSMKTLVIGATFENMLAILHLSNKGRALICVSIFLNLHKAGRRAVN
ncbi:hypothetical protein JS87_25040 [Vibrio vulnificus]|nr:hypothetical protein JS87_25040 [Vibrio vulnificus]